MNAVSLAAGAARPPAVRAFVEFVLKAFEIRPARQILRSDAANAPPPSRNGTARAPSRDPSAPLDGMTVLIVDDNETNIFVLQAFLAGFGPKSVLTARSGEEALGLLRSRECDMIFMDIQMPGLDGVATTQAIRNGSDRRRATAPIVAVTAACRVFGPGDAAQAGMDGYVEKPVSREVLRREIEKAAGLVEERRSRSSVA